MTPDNMADAEAALIAASEAGDLAAIDAASARIDALEAPRTIPTLLASALWYAEQGLKVFPLSPGTKIPFKGSSGCKDASSNPEVIRGWWEDSPDANIGIATGHLVDVVDIDGHEGQRSRVREWEARFAQIDADALAKVLTPRSGGMHIYVAAQGGGNHAGLCPGIDYRGVGGYVVAPPSTTDQGSYRFLGVPTLDNLSERVS